jgi:hypothetical protein
MLHTMLFYKEQPILHIKLHPTRNLRKRKQKNVSVTIVTKTICGTQTSLNISTGTATRG